MAWSLNSIDQTARDDAAALEQQLQTLSNSVGIDQTARDANAAVLQDLEALLDSRGAAGGVALLNSSGLLVNGQVRGIYSNANGSFLYLENMLPASDALLVCWKTRAVTGYADNQTQGIRTFVFPRSFAADPTVFCTLDTVDGGQCPVWTRNVSPSSVVVGLDKQLAITGVNMLAIGRG